MKTVLRPALAFLLMSIAALSPAVARDDTGGGSVGSCYQCAERIVWNQTTVFCETGYLMGFTTCRTVDVPGPQSSINSCVLGMTCYKGKSWPLFSVY